MKSHLFWAFVCLIGTSCGRVPTADIDSAREALPTSSVLVGEATQKREADGSEDREKPQDDRNDLATIHVRSGEDIQAALDRAADSPEIHRVIVHEGTYRPSAPRQALIWFNARHDGITLQAEGEVVLTAANPDVADRGSEHFPAIVNHVVYFGDGISPRTVLRGFRITGANDFVTLKAEPNIEPADSDPRLRKTMFFYTDGGGIKIFGRSYPTLENLEIHDNYSSPCGAGISVEHRGFTTGHVTIRNCVFRNNRVPLTGSAVDLLDHEVGSSAVIENCLFVNNLSNERMDARSRKLGTWKPRDGHGALTVFPPSKAVVRRCTFIGNRNGVDDLGEESIYEDCIFWQNEAGGGWPVGERYDVDIKNGAGVDGCFFGGPVAESAPPVDPRENTLKAPDPEFDSSYVPQNPLYQQAGYRPAAADREGGGADSDRAARLGGAAVPLTGENRLQVLLRGRDFRWHISYPGEDGRFMTADDLQTESRLHLPAETEVEIRTESDDYLYTVYLPDFDVRQIAVPELTHFLHLKTAASGVSPLLGDQLCGYTHPDLIGEIVIHSPADFLRWYSRLSPQGP